MIAKADALDALIQDAAAAGVIPAKVTRPEQDVRPWPIVLMSALGAWLAALPLVLALGFMLGSFLEKGGGTYIVAILALGVAVLLIRPRGVSLFVEQLGVPCVLVGGGLLGYALFRDMDDQLAALALSAVSLALAAILPRDWLRVLLGVVACGLLALGSVGSHYSWSYGNDSATLYLAWMLALGIWLGAHWLQKNVYGDGRGAPVAAYIESVSTGWGLAILLGLISWSGKTFMMSATVGDGLMSDLANELATRHGGSWYAQWLPLLSVAMVVAAAFWMQRRWPSLRQLPAAGVALVLAALAWFLPALGPVLLVLAFCVTSARLRVAVAAGVAAAWVIGSFYYLLAWPLATKALVLAAAGLVLGVLSWLATRGALLKLADQPAGALASHPRAARAGLLAGLLLVLVVANGAIWQKEQLIATGEPVFIPLAPADPRSLMQGDFMRLNFLGFTAFEDLDSLDRRTARPHVVLLRDARGVATVQGRDDGKPLAPGALRMELTPKDGRWVLVTDAWFFREGEAERWEKARFGEFRVMPDGRALLVGMRGENLERL